MSHEQGQPKMGPTWTITLLLLLMSNAGVVAAPCSTAISSEWVVRDTASATALAKALNCSGGVFNVKWEGSVVVDHDIHVADGTSLYVVGVGSEARIEGGGNTRAFTVTGAFLSTSNLKISNGNASYGGAIASDGSSMSFDATSFIGNVAVENGGALHIVNSSTCTLGGQTAFVGNSAGDGGGAVFISANSNLTWEGQTSFAGNTAEGFGGALKIVDGSRVSWGANTSFSENTSVRGGAVHLEGHSMLSWAAETSFSKNGANNTGGAVKVYNNSAVSWTAKTSFSNNIATYGGAVHVEKNSSVSWEVETSFSGNTAEGSGGALDVYDGSSASWGAELSLSNGSTASRSELTAFVGNTAKDVGGAVSIYDHAQVSWAASTMFSGNGAMKSGGAVNAGYGSTVSWTVETSFFNNSAHYGGAVLAGDDDSGAHWEGETSFLANTAGWSGGALNVYNGARMSWAAVTSFYNNSAIYGGAILIGEDSTVSWEAGTSFSGNTAEGSGGALNAFDNCSVYWKADTYFTNNTANYAGAIYAFNNSNVTWNADTSFSGNIADESGGAVLIDHGCSLSWGAETSFLNNTAGGSGGAVYMSSLVSGSEDVFSSLTIEGETKFLENSCGADGGAMSLIGSISFDFRTESITYMRNFAAVAGGAVFIAGAGIGPKLVGVEFNSNSAFVGGGVYVTGSGNTITEYEFRDPTTFDRCQFIGNTATAGGAVNSGAGQDVFNNTLFRRNGARSGGALSLAGQASLEHCTFVDNTASEDEGPAISNVGHIATIRRASFAGNVFECELGMFLNYSTSGDIFDAVCKGFNTNCTECDYGPAEKIVPLCSPEPEHSKSDGGTHTIEMLKVDPGYWRAAKNSTMILPCYNTEACNGGLTGRAQYCQDGYEGPYCSVCGKDYTAGPGYTCNDCSDITVGVVIVSVVALVAIIGLAVFLMYMVSGETDRVARGIGARMVSHGSLQSLKSAIVACQILTQFSEVANVTYPDVYQAFLDGIDLVNFDLSWLISTGCLLDVNFHERLIISTIGPFIAMAILGGTYSLAVRKNRRSEAAVAKVRQKHLSTVLFLTFVIYSSVSSTLFQMFACDPLDDGNTYLRADYRIECDSPEHRALQIYAGFMVFVYPIGIPLFYAALLLRHRDVLMNKDGREVDSRVKSTIDLWKPYTPECFYYEIVECIRRILLAGVVVFIYPNTAAQVAVTIVMAVFFIFVAEALSPYESRWDTWVSRMGHAIVFIGMFVALLMKVDVSKERTSSQRVFGSILVSVHAGMILAALVESIAVCCSMRKSDQEDTKSRLHRTGVTSFELYNADDAETSPNIVGRV